MSEAPPPATSASSGTLPALPPAGGLQRSLGLFGATLVGVAAIMGAGVFVLSGVAFRVAGPSAILAFALNGLLALVTAFSFAELAAAFPESGGSYVFARKVFPISGAFATGWVLWFAYVVAGVLYALGFASFLAFVIEQIAGQLGQALSIGSGLRVAGALITCAAAVGLLLRGGAGAGGAVTVAKVVAFLLLVIPGLFLFAGSPRGRSTPRWCRPSRSAWAGRSWPWASRSSPWRGSRSSRPWARRCATRGSRSRGPCSSRSGSRS